MARGWESKSVEDQINAREAAISSSREKATDIERRGTRQGLLRARTRTLTLLAAARDQDRSLLERTLADLDARLAELD